MNQTKFKCVLVEASADTSKNITSVISHRAEVINISDTINRNMRTVIQQEIHDIFKVKEVREVPR